MNVQLTLQGWRCGSTLIFCDLWVAGAIQRNHSLVLDRVYFDVAASGSRSPLGIFNCEVDLSLPIEVRCWRENISSAVRWLLNDASFGRINSGCAHNRQLIMISGDINIATHFQKICSGKSFIGVFLGLAKTQPSKVRIHNGIVIDCV